MTPPSDSPIIVFQPAAPPTNGAGNEQPLDIVEGHFRIVPPQAHWTVRGALTLVCILVAILCLVASWAAFGHITGGAGLGAGFAVVIAVMYLISEQVK